MQDQVAPEANRRVTPAHARAGYKTFTKYIFHQIEGIGQSVLCAKAQRLNGAIAKDRTMETLPSLFPTADVLPLAWVEPNRDLLRQPEPGQLLFKVVKVRYLIDMLQRNYLHFQRVDAYTDDTTDGEQLPLDRPVGAGISFEAAPAYTFEKYYDSARARTYACCFSLEHSAYLWERYAPRGTRCVSCSTSRNCGNV